VAAFSRIQREIKQNRPFASRGQEAMVALLRTADVVRRTISRAVEPAGVTLQQYNVLRILRGAGAEGLPTLEIGERLLEQTPGTTRLIDRLVEKGWVCRHEGRDRRQVLCAITPDGLSLLASLDGPVLAADSLLEEAGMTSSDLSRFVSLLDAVRSAHSAEAPDAVPADRPAPDPNPPPKLQRTAPGSPRSNPERKKR